MSDLKELYIRELQDLWSANDQMHQAVGKLADTTSDEMLSQRLLRARDGIDKHTQMLKSLVQEAGGDCENSHCTGMEGIVAEAQEHAVNSRFEGPARDVAIIAQYQRMCHYGIAGFGTAKAYAAALGLDDAIGKLEQAVANIYDSDEFMSDLAERSKNLEAA